MKRWEGIFRVQRIKDELNIIVIWYYAEIYVLELLFIVRKLILRTRNEKRSYLKNTWQDPKVQRIQIQTWYSTHGKTQLNSG